MQYFVFVLLYFFILFYLRTLQGYKADTLHADSLDVVVQMKCSEINSSFIKV